MSFSHFALDAFINTPDATDVASLLALLKAIQEWLRRHYSNEKVHFAVDTEASSRLLEDVVGTLNTVLSSQKHSFAHHIERGRPIHDERDDSGPVAINTDPTMDATSRLFAEANELKRRCNLHSRQLRVK